jgi:hypothetical protein
VENYSEIVQELISPYSAMGCNMSLILHFLNSHLDFIPEKMEAVSNEHGKKFHQAISKFGKGYSGKWSPNILDDYCWNFIRETSTGESKRQKKMK